MGELADQISDSYQVVHAKVFEWLEDNMEWTRDKNDDHDYELYLVSQDRVVAYTELAFWASQKFTPAYCEDLESFIFGESRTDVWYSPVGWDAVPLSGEADRVLQKITQWQLSRVQGNDEEDALAVEGDYTDFKPSTGRADLNLPKAWLGYSDSAHGGGARGE